MKDLSNIIKEFEKIVKVNYVKRTPKHEPTSSYYHLVRCIAECMMISDNRIGTCTSVLRKRLLRYQTLMLRTRTNKKEIIVHETLPENQSMDVSESECNIVHETLSQNNLSDVPTNFIMELKDDEHIEPSVIEKDQFILTYSSAVEIFWINLTLRINRRSWHHQYKRYYINHLQNKRHIMMNWPRVLLKRKLELTEL